MSQKKIGKVIGPIDICRSIVHKYKFMEKSIDHTIDKEPVIWFIM